MEQGGDGIQRKEGFAKLENKDMIHNLVKGEKLIILEKLKTFSEAAERCLAYPQGRVQVAFM